MKYWSSMFGVLLCWLLLHIHPLAADTAATEADTNVTATAAPAASGFQLKEFLMHHVMEAHDWHILDIPKGGKEYISVTLPLPWIVYSSEKGLDIFMLSGHTDAEINANANARGYDVHGARIGLKDNPKAFILNLSLSKSVIQMLIVALLMIWIFSSVAKGYVKNEGKAPSGIQSFFEPIIMFVRDEIAAPNLKGKHMAFMPYLLTLFFFIWFSNLFGLTPLNSNIFGNISMALALAVLTLIITKANTTGAFWGHVLWFPGVPVPVKLIMLPVELVGIISKPFSLTIRLFANIAGGHFMVLSLVCLIFVVGKLGENLVGGVAITFMSVPFTIFILLLELLVAVLQAYVFTLLTCVFIGSAMEEGHAH
jgi:F-type H+-transporting ATPase subunit a